MSEDERGFLHATKFFTIRAWQDLVGTWVNQVFGPTQPGSVERAIRHLKEEVAELEAEPSGEELADVTLLCLGLAERMGVDLLTEMQKKHFKNQQRQWVATSDGYRKHVKGIHD